MNLNKLMKPPAEKKEEVAKDQSQENFIQKPKQEWSFQGQPLNKNKKEEKL